MENKKLVEFKTKIIKFLNPPLKNKNNIKNLEKHKFFINILLVLSFIFFPILIIMNLKYGPAAAHNVQEELLKNKAEKNFNSFKYFDKIQTLWTRTFKNYKKIPTDLIQKNYKKVLITTDDNKELNCFVYSKNSSDENKNKWVIVLHGWTQNKYAVMHIVDLYLRLKYNVFVYDQRGHGENPTTKTTIGFLEKNDLDLVVDHIIHKYDVAEINFHGQSMGAITILNYLTIYQSKIKNKLFNVAILNGCTANLTNQMKYFYKDYFQLPSLFFYLGLVSTLKKECRYSPRSLNVLSKIKRTYRWPFLLIHAENDQMIEVTDSINIFKAKEKCENPIKSEIYMPSRGDHVQEFPFDQVKYTKKITDFLKKIKK